MDYTGRIEVIFGPMFSGKSTELQRKIRRYQIAEKRCLIINFAQDNRYCSDNTCVTHDLIKVDAFKVHKLSDADAIVNEHEIIGVDEGQFFEDLIEKVDEWANKGKIVIIAALDATFQRMPFNNVCNLLAIAEDVKKLHSVCNNCKRKGAFTKRITNSDELEVIGGLEAYKPVCRFCFYQGNAEKYRTRSDITDDGDEL